MTLAKNDVQIGPSEDDPMAAALVPYHDRDGFIWYDGKLVPWREATLHVLTHGLHYASAVFEGERAYGGQIFKLREHTERLIESARMLDFEIPYSAEQIDAACNEVMQANKLVDCYVRPIAWRGSEQMGVSAQLNKIHLAVAAWDWGSYFDPQGAPARHSHRPWPSIAGPIRRPFPPRPKRPAST